MFARAGRICAPRIGDLLIASGGEAAGKLSGSNLLLFKSGYFLAGNVGGIMLGVLFDELFTSLITANFRKGGLSPKIIGLEITQSLVSRVMLQGVMSLVMKLALPLPLRLFFLIGGMTFSNLIGQWTVNKLFDDGLNPFQTSNFKGVLLHMLDTSMVLGVGGLRNHYFPLHKLPSTMNEKQVASLERCIDHEIEHGRSNAAAKEQLGILRLVLENAGFTARQQAELCHTIISECGFKSSEVFHVVSTYCDNLIKVFPAPILKTTLETIAFRMHFSAKVGVESLNELTQVSESNHWSRSEACHAITTMLRDLNLYGLSLRCAKRTFRVTTEIGATPEFALKYYDLQRNLDDLDGEHSLDINLAMLTRNKPSWLTWKRCVSLYSQCPEDVKPILFSQVMLPMAYSYAEDLSEKDIKLIAGVPDGRFFLRVFMDYCRGKMGAKRVARDVVQQQERSGLWPIAEIGKIYAEGKKSVCVLNYAEDQFGDENVRCLPWLKAFLASNGDDQTRVTIVTRRGGYYEHPRVNVVGISDFEAGCLAQTHFDVVVRVGFNKDQHWLNETCYDRLNMQHAEVVVDIDNFQLLNFRWKNKDYSEEDLNLHIENDLDVYDLSSKLIPGMGLQLVQGEGLDLSHIPVAGLRDPDFMGYWRNEVFLPANGRKIIFFNPFGGLHVEKGFYDNSEVQDYSLGKMREIVRYWVDAGCHVVLAPNGEEVATHLERRRTWGQKQMLLEFLRDIPSITILDEPKSLPRGYLNAAAFFSDAVVTVEGGMFHAVYNIGKPVIVLRMFRFEGFEWLPRIMGRNQRLTNPKDAKNDVLKFLSIEKPS